MEKTGEKRRSWNKGLTWEDIVGPEKAKILKEGWSKKNKGRKHSEETKEKMRKPKNMSEEGRKIQVEKGKKLRGISYEERFGKERAIEIKKKQVETMRKKGGYTWERTQEYKDKMKEALLKYSGENNHNWRGGISKIKYTRVDKDTIYERDGHCCYLCKRTKLDSRQPIEIHHINFNRVDNLENNLISLCRDCHNLFHRDREIGEMYLTELMKKRVLGKK